MSNDSQIVRSTGTSLQREGFEGKSLETRHETSSTALAAQAQAEITARYLMALQRPRDDDNVRALLLKECRRPTFAAKAFYSIPRKDRTGRLKGKLTGTPGRVEGLTVRFAESAIR